MASQVISQRRGAEAQTPDPCVMRKLGFWFHTNCTGVHAYLVIPHYYTGLHRSVCKRWVIASVAARSKSFRVRRVEDTRNVTARVKFMTRGFDDYDSRWTREFLKGCCYVRKLFNFYIICEAFFVRQAWLLGLYMRVPPLTDAAAATRSKCVLFILLVGICCCKFLPCISGVSVYITGMRCCESACGYGMRMHRRRCRHQGCVCSHYWYTHILLQIITLYIIYDVGDITRVYVRAFLCLSKAQFHNKNLLRPGSTSITNNYHLFNLFLNNEFINVSFTIWFGSGGPEGSAQGPTPALRRAGRARPARSPRTSAPTFVAASSASSYLTSMTIVSFVNCIFWDSILNFWFICSRYFGKDFYY